MSAAGQLRLRFPSFEDSAKLGLLVAAALVDAPSAPIDRDELNADLEQVGREFVSAHLFGNETLLLAEVGRHAAGIARLVPREFQRSAHVGTLQVLVTPTLRHRGVGRQLLAAALEEGFARRGFLRIETPVADHDLGMARLVGAPRWHLERVERAALRVFDELHDIRVWVADPT
ncbi:MAG: GNAT family N-acetyltransferase [Deltaproteobacteria bacterium]|nr:GNAT family N-acetyltransferase [Deltaproteobacteria bacterium]